jgi:hypothetical protein
MGRALEARVEPLCGSMCLDAREGHTSTTIHTRDSLVGKFPARHPYKDTLLE